MNIRFKTFLLLLAFTCFQCARQESGIADEEIDSVTEVTVHLNDKKQIIRNFGGSDAWACNFVGQWPDAQRNQVADWFFSTDMDEQGKPKGIGMSLWRFNIGAGSAAQDNISDEWRRAEGFMTSTLTYDWSKQAGQQWFMHAAKQRGVDQFVGFNNSPPVQLTKNQKAYSSDGEHANLSKQHYKTFAVFLADVTKYFHEQGITLNYLSPFNEPQWDWTGNNQEGTPFTNQEIFDVTFKLDSVLTARSMNTKIQIGEAAKMNYLYELADKPTRGNLIEDFFTTASPRYMGNFTHVDRMISGHSYFTSAPMETMKQVRKAVADKIKQANVPLEFWQTEYCVLGDQEEIPGPGKDTGMTTALYVARLIHHDLTIAQAAAWHWWTSVSVYDYKDGLVYADKNKTNGKVEDTKLLWALGNYSRFIRPGAVRLGVTSTQDTDNVKGIMISAYVHEESKKLITVIINYGNLASSISLKVDGGAVASYQPYLTAAGADDDLKPLSPSDAGEAISIPAKSVVTLVGDLN